MNNFVELSKKIYDKYFEKFLKYINHNVNFLNFIWLTFAYLKKKILKRKNDFESSSSMICCLFEILRKECLLLNSKYETQSEIQLGYYELYSKEISSNVNLNPEIFKETEKFLKENFSQSTNTFFTLLNSKSIAINYENFKLVEIAYYDMLILDELDDIKIFENFFTEKKLKSKCFNLNKSNKDLLLTKPIYSKNPKNSIDMFDSPSPILNKISTNSKADIDLFFKDVSEYSYLDISYLFIKYAKFNIENNSFAYEKLFNVFEQKFLIRLKKSDDEWYSEIIYENHKNLFLKLADELLQQEKNKFDEKEFNLILNDESFHFNFLIIVFFIYLNFLLIEKNSFLEEICVNYLENLNQYNYFEFQNLFKIITNLTKIEMPNDINSMIKKFQKGLISYVIWKSDSFLFAEESEIRNGAEEYKIEFKVKFCLLRNKNPFREYPIKYCFMLFLLFINLRIF